MTKPSAQDLWKKAAAESAAQSVKDGMVVGLGTGTTSAFLLRALAKRIAEEHLRMTGLPTSNATAKLATSLGIPLSTFAQQPVIDLTIDGADEVQRGTLFLIKGLGGALLHEKIVAAASKRMIVVADQTKIVDQLGTRAPVPVEVVQFGWEVTSRKLEALGSKTTLRMRPDQQPYISDSGNYILDCAFGPMTDPKTIARALDQTVGVVEHGLFLDLASEAAIGGDAGVTSMRRT